MDKIKVSELNRYGFVKVEKVITVSLQLGEDELEQIIEFNKQNNYEYIIKYDEHNLVDSENIIYLIRQGYIMSVRGGIGITDSLVFTHKYYPKDNGDDDNEGSTD